MMQNIYNERSRMRCEKSDGVKYCHPDFGLRLELEEATAIREPPAARICYSIVQQSKVEQEHA
jgi:hypothetical protein